MSGQYLVYPASRCDVSATTVFLAPMTAWWQCVVSKSRTRLLSQEGSSLEVRGQGRPHNHHSIPDLSWQAGLAGFPTQKHCHPSVF